LTQFLKLSKKLEKHRVKVDRTMIVTFKSATTTEAVITSTTIEKAKISL
jgi:hypothetical protein